MKFIDEKGNAMMCDECGVAADFAYMSESIDNEFTTLTCDLHKRKTRIVNFIESGNYTDIFYELTGIRE